MYHDLNGRTALADAAESRPLEITLLLVLLEERSDRQRMEHELRTEIERLKADLL